MARSSPESVGVRALARHGEHLGHSQFGVVDIALQFTHPNRQIHDATIRIDDGVAGVFPSDIVIAEAGACPVLLKAIAIQVAVLVYPCETAFRRGQVFTDERGLTAPPIGFR